MMDLINALVSILNYIIVPGLTYGSQLALGALGVTLIYGVLRFSNFAHGDTMAFGTTFVPSSAPGGCSRGIIGGAAAHRPSGAALRHPVTVLSCWPPTGWSIASTAGSGPSRSSSSSPRPA
jgi:hypothetical protein